MIGRLSSVTVDHTFRSRGGPGLQHSSGQGRVGMADVVTGETQDA